MSISCEAAGEVWHWSLSGVKGLRFWWRANARNFTYRFSSWCSPTSECLVWQPRGQWIGSTLLRTTLAMVCCSLVHLQWNDPLVLMNSPAIQAREIHPFIKIYRAWKEIAILKLFDQPGGGGAAPIGKYRGCWSYRLGVTFLRSGTAKVLNIRQ